jgi:hypothetical protein
LVVSIDRGLVRREWRYEPVKVGTFDDEDRIVSLVDPLNITEYQLRQKTGASGNVATEQRPQPDFPSERSSQQRPNDDQTYISIRFDVSGDSKILLFSINSTT